MKSLIFSCEANAELSENYLSFQEQDALMEQLHYSFEYISRTTANHKQQQLALKIDCLKFLLELEICSTAILITSVQILDEGC